MPCCCRNEARRLAHDPTLSSARIRRRPGPAGCDPRPGPDGAGAPGCRSVERKRPDAQPEQRTVRSPGARARSGCATIGCAGVVSSGSTAPGHCARVQHCAGERSSDVDGGPCAPSSRSGRRGPGGAASDARYPDPGACNADPRSFLRHVCTSPSARTFDGAEHTAVRQSLDLCARTHALGVRRPRSDFTPTVRGPEADGGGSRLERFTRTRT